MEATVTIRIIVIQFSSTIYLFRNVLGKQLQENVTELVQSSKKKGKIYKHVRRIHIHNLLSSSSAYNNTLKMESVYHSLMELSPS
jgi:hypothetical protein